MKPAKQRHDKALGRMAAGLLCLLLQPLAGQDKEPKPPHKPPPSFAQPGSVIKGFSAPHFDAKGELIGRVHSERAIVQPDGKYRVEGIHVQGFKDGRPDYELSLPSCVYNQDKHIITTDETVRISRTNVTITGVGAVWDVVHFQGKLLSNVVMVISDIERGIVR